MFPRVRTWQSDLRATPIPRRTALLAGAALPLGLMIGKAAPATARKPAPSPRLTLPAPTGRHRLGTTSLYLIDPSRPDAWVPTQRAQVMIQLWPLPRGLCGALDLGRVGMFGQSDGGSTTAHAMNADARIKVGVSLDGTLWTPQAVAAGPGRPLLLFGRQDLDHFEASTWAAFWKTHRGPGLQLNLIGSTHDTFTDFAVLVPQVAPILGKPKSWVIAGVGTINGQRAVTIQRTYIGAYFDRYLRHRDSPLLAGPSPRYPEVRFAPQRA